MIKRLRPLLFLLFVTVFFVTASSVVFYAFGYRFSFERGIFVYTGSLSLKANTDPVIITVDSISVPENRLGLLNNSIHITGLNPGEHFIEVGAIGYRPWSKKVVIQSGLTTEFWNIVLVEETYERQNILHTEQAIKLFPAPNGLLATVKKNGNRYSVEVLDINAKTSEEVFVTTDASFSPTLRTNLEWSPESHKLIIPLIRDNAPLYAVVDIATKKSVFLNDLAHIPASLSDVRWDATHKNTLFFLDQSTLYRIDTGADDPLPVLIKDNVLAYDISGKNIYYVSSENNIVYRIPASRENPTPEQITPTSFENHPGDSYTLITYDENQLALIDRSSGKLTIFNKRVPNQPFKKIDLPVLGVQYSDDGKKLLFYTTNEISVYFNQDWPAQPMRAIDSVIQIARFSSPIENVLWTEDYEHIIFSLGQNIKIAELDNRDRRDFSDLLVLDAPPLQILPRFGENALYIVQALPETASADNTVFRIILTQTTNFFGL